MYLDIAQLPAGEQDDASRNVAAGNAVLAGIAAADAICCVHLGKRSRGQDHREAVSLLAGCQPQRAEARRRPRHSARSEGPGALRRHTRRRHQARDDRTGRHTPRGSIRSIDHQAVTRL